MSFFVFSGSSGAGCLRSLGRRFAGCPFFFAGVSRLMPFLLLALILDDYTIAASASGKPNAAIKIGKKSLQIRRTRFIGGLCFRKNRFANAA
jgi:hypothetical protein